MNFKKDMKKIALILGISVTSLIWSSYANGIVPSLNNVNINNGDILTKDVINNLQWNINKIYNWIKGWFNINGDIKLIWNSNRGITLKVNSHSWGIMQDTSNNLLINKDNNNILKLTNSNSILNVPLTISNMLEIDWNSKKWFIKNNNWSIEIRTEDVNDDWIILVSNWHDVANFKKSWVIIDSRDISLKASWTNKWLRINSDGSVCMGACW